MKPMPIDLLLASAYLVYAFGKSSMPSMPKVSVPDIPTYDWLGLVSLFFAVLILLTIVARAARTVRPTERGLVERFGEYRRFVNPGLTFLFPIIDRLVKINVTEQMSHVEPQDVITKDKVVMSVDAVVFFKVKSDEESVKASVYNVNAFQQQIEMLARTTLRNIIGKMDMAEANVGRGIINEELTRELAAQSVQWGVEIMRAELKDLSPPRDIQESMNTVIKANNAKLAAADMANAKENEADGFRRAAIKNAEGQKQGAILEAEGRKISLEKVAEGQANAIRMVNEAYTKYFKDSAITAKQLETIADSLRNNSKIIVPEGSTLSLILNEAQSLGNQIVLPLPATKSKPPQEGMTQ
jgi:regulator of protease activity HflC (stomatin/prohibitin superfamily)